MFFFVAICVCYHCYFLLIICFDAIAAVKRLLFLQILESWDPFWGKLEDRSQGQL